jgi:hypothetical protein
VRQGLHCEIVPHYIPCQSRAPARAASWRICMVSVTCTPRVIVNELGRRDGATFVWALDSSFRPSRAGLTLVDVETTRANE